MENRNIGGSHHLIDMFSEDKIALSREIRNHPQLMEILAEANHGMDNFELMLAEIALYCGVILDGEYMPADIDRICGVLYKKLAAERAGIVIVTPSGKE